MTNSDSKNEETKKNIPLWVNALRVMAVAAGVVILFGLTGLILATGIPAVTPNVQGTSSVILGGYADTERELSTEIREANQLFEETENYLQSNGLSKERISYEYHPLTAPVTSDSDQSLLFYETHEYEVTGEEATDRISWLSELYEKAGYTKYEPSQEAPKNPRLDWDAIVFYKGTSQTSFERVPTNEYFVLMFDERIKEGEAAGTLRVQHETSNVTLSEVPVGTGVVTTQQEVDEAKALLAVQKVKGNEKWGCLFTPNTVIGYWDEQYNSCWP